MKKKWEEKKTEVAYEVKYKQKPIFWESSYVNAVHCKTKNCHFSNLEEFLSKVYHLHNFKAEI